MTLLQVNYERALLHDDERQAAALRHAAQAISGLPGLIWKIWLYDDDAHLAGGLYLFDSEADARRWGDGPMETALRGHPGIGRIDKRYFAVDAELSAVTGAQPTLASEPLAARSGGS